MLTVPKQEPLRLDFYEQGRKVLVKPQDHDAFVVSVEEAAAACQIANRNQSYTFGLQFEELLRRLAKWIQLHKAAVRKAYVTVRDAGFLFLVVQKSPALDLKLEEDLTELDLEVAHEEAFGLLRLNVLALPSSSKEAYESFLESCAWEYRHAK